MKNEIADVLASNREKFYEDLSSAFALLSDLFLLLTRKTNSFNEMLSKVSARADHYLFFNRRMNECAEFVCWLSRPFNIIAKTVPEWTEMEHFKNLRDTYDKNGIDTDVLLLRNPDTLRLLEVSEDVLKFILDEITNRMIDNLERDDIAREVLSELLNKYGFLRGAVKHLSLAFNNPHFRGELDQIRAERLDKSRAEN